MKKREFCEMVARMGGIYDTENYRYIVDGNGFEGYVLRRLPIDIIGTTSAIGAEPETVWADPDLRNVKVIVCGEVIYKQYKQVCSDLGFSAKSHFVRVTASGRIGFTVGKPNEIKALRYACYANGYEPTSSLRYGWM